MIHLDPDAHLPPTTSKHRQREANRAAGLCRCGRPREAGYLQCRVCRLGANRASQAHADAQRELRPTSMVPFSDDATWLAQREQRQRERAAQQAARSRYV